MIKRQLNLILLTAVTVLTCSSCLQTGQPASASDETSDEASGEVSSFFDTSAKKKNAKKTATTATSPVSTGLVAGGKDGQMLRRTAYTTSYNRETRTANWVAWALTGEHTTGPYKRDGYKFHEDSDVPAPRATNDDYFRSGYNRGHLCPSADNKWSEKAQSESFLFTNICPMNRNLDGGDWNDLEQACRRWAKRYEKLYIVCGPVYLDRDHRKLGKNKVVVPDQYFKVVMTFGKNGNSPKALGFLYDNRSGRHQMSTYVHTVDDIERLTGFDFFPFLNDKLEAKVESHADLGEW